MRITRRIVNASSRENGLYASGMMSDRYIALDPSLTVRQALNKIKQTEENNLYFADCFVVDKNNRLLGRLTLRSLLLAEMDELVSNIFTPNVIFIEPNTRNSQIIEVMRQNSLLTIPVVDNRDNLIIIGAVSLDILASLVEKEATREMHHGAGIASNAGRYYLSTSIWRHASSRLPWLIFLLFASLLAGALVSHYEASFIKMPVLVAFIPLIMGLAGAGGSQSSTVIIRSMAVGEIQKGQYWRAFYKELTVSLICGIAMGSVMFLYSLILYKNPPLGFVLWLGLLATIVFAKSLGMILPILAKYCRMDPALISSPLVTIIADIFGIFAYFTFATIMLDI